MESCPLHPSGHVCSVSGSRHRDHAAWVIHADQAPGWVYWSEPEPPPSPFVSKKKPSKGQLMDAVQRIQGTGSARTSDPRTSKDAAKLRTGSQKYLLLVEYGAAEDLTDEEAAERAGLVIQNRGWWQRCADLRSEGLIADTGRTRKSSVTNEDRMVCAITDEGRRALT